MCVGKAGCAKCALAEIFKNAKRGLFLFSSLSVVSVVVQLQCWSSRVSPVVKSVCKTICLLLLVIVNVSVVFFACAPTFSICKVGDCGLQTYQTEMKLKRATTVEFTAISPILYIHC